MVVSNVNRSNVIVWAALVSISGCTQSPDQGALIEDYARAVDITWVEKYVTFEQDRNGNLSETDFHFLAETIYSDREKVERLDAILSTEAGREPLATFEASDPHDFTNGMYWTRKSKSHDSIDELEAAYPPDMAFVWEIDTPEGQLRLDPIRIGGPNHETEVPAASPLFLSQGDKPVPDVHSIDSERPLLVQWNPFTIGKPLEGSEWEDFIFFLISDCHGEDQFTSGAPEQEGGAATFDTTSIEIPANSLEPGMRYVMFISHVNYVDYNKSHGIEQFAANSFGVELKIQTAGTAESARTCPEPAIKAPYLWAGKTPGDAGLVPWPGIPTRGEL